MNSTISLKELLEAGCHFGHQAQRWHPKAASYIYTERDKVHIIDLVKTREGLKTACEYLTKTISSGGKVLFVGTKRQAKEIIREEAKRAGVFFISERWPAGLLTNFEVMKKNLDHMRDLKEKIVSEETKSSYTKREIGMWQKELNKLELLYGGIAELASLPTVMFVVDVRKEAGAVKEANAKGVMVVGVVDTNSDPTSIDYPIPANDDAIGSIKIVTKYITDAVEEGKRLYEKKKVEDKEKVSRETEVARLPRETEVAEKKTESEKLPTFAKASAGKKVKSEEVKKKKTTVKKIKVKKDKSI